ncbi:hypothetical protein BDP27DRAFT_1370050 [Rhodocollybia butyracea]|uniref:Uncharacterized protein n=1 Tax=Rhodocollybia butyracea TaxID=206335 RepID=A0A9P5PCK3_9AGAR|nr:hypothetical protein BDP27DRAFT_1370050 [Rhodocollybia butyracea]
MAFDASRIDNIRYPEAQGYIRHIVNRPSFIGSGAGYIPPQSLGDLYTQEIIAVDGVNPNPIQIPGVPDRFYRVLTTCHTIDWLCVTLEHTQTPLNHVGWAALPANNLALQFLRCEVQFNARRMVLPLPVPPGGYPYAPAAVFNMVIGGVPTSTYHWHHSRNARVWCTMPNQPPGLIYYKHRDQTPDEKECAKLDFQPKSSHTAMPRPKFTALPDSFGAASQQAAF